MKKQFMLKPGKQTTRRPFVYGFDIETYDNNKKFLICSLHNGVEPKIYKNKHDFIEEIKKKKYAGAYIAATNLSFDFFGTFFATDDMQHFRTLFRGSNLIFAETYIEDNKFTLTPRKKRKKITFIDTMNFASLSVEKMGKILKFQKLQKPQKLGKKPETDAEWDEMIKYNVRDSEISKKFMDFLIESFIKLGANVRKTIASTSMSLFRNKYFKDVVFPHPPEQLLDQFKSYYGGRTEAFKRGKIENHNYYDFNSLYPSVMRDFVFPDPNTKRITRANTKDYIMNFEGCSHVTIEIPKTRIPILPIKSKDGKVIFGYGKLDGWWTHIELRKAMEQGGILMKVHKTYYFKKTCRPFKEFVDDMYKKRQLYKLEDSPMEYVVKILMNSLYGKFGQKFIDRDNWMPFNLTLNQLDKYDYFERHGDFIRVKQNYTTPSCFCIPIWASYVTAYARLKLWDHIKNIDVAYVDTDSIMTSEELQHSTELGKLKFERFVIEGIIVRPKFYSLWSVEKQDLSEYVKIKGLPVKFNYLEFKGFLCDPTSRYNKFMKFKEAIRRGFLPNEIIETSKTFNLSDDKRIWNKEFDPLTTQESQAMDVTDIELKRESIILQNNNI